MDLAQYVQLRHGTSHAIDHEYLKRLTSIPQGQLEAELRSLRSKLASTSESKQSLAASHVNAFVDTRSSMDRLTQLAHSVKKSSKDSLDASLSIPRVPENAYTHLQNLLANDVMVYNHVDKIQELLSLPELVKDYVSSGNYSAVLDLASMTERLQNRFPQSQLIQNLVKDVRNGVDSMRDIFLDSLRETSRLPMLTRAVLFLQRLNYKDLEVVFVESRWQFLLSQWEQIPAQLKKTQPLAYLKRVVEIYREDVFATINGYHAIFQEKRSLDEKSSKGDHRLSVFSRQALDALLTSLREHAPLITDHSERASLWLQLAFCANSLGRMGADFWPFLDAEILSQEEWKEAARHQRDMARRVSKLSI